MAIILPFCQHVSIPTLKTQENFIGNNALPYYNTSIQLHRGSFDNIIPLTNLKFGNLPTNNAQTFPCQ